MSSEKLEPPGVRGTREIWLGVPRLYARTKGGQMASQPKPLAIWNQLISKCWKPSVKVFHQGGPHDKGE
jgi:hypothetical protein